MACQSLPPLLPSSPLLTLTLPLSRPVSCVCSDGSTWRLPSPSAQSLTLLLDALSRKGEWQRCLDLLASTRDVITDPAQLAHVYKTAIGASTNRST